MLSAAELGDHALDVPDRFVGNGQSIGKSVIHEQLAAPIAKAAQIRFDCVEHAALRLELRNVGLEVEFPGGILEWRILWKSDVTQVVRTQVGDVRPARLRGSEQPVGPVRFRTAREPRIYR